MRNNRGFTLIETVIFIVVVGIALSSIVFLFTTTVGHSHEPLIRQKAIAVASAYMDEILSKRWDENTPMGGGCVITPGGSCSVAWTASTFYATESIVVPTTSNGHKYQVSNSGTSSGIEPVWPTDGSTFIDGTVTWVDIGDHTVLSDCGATPANCGPDGENRSEYDDLDDYNGLSDDPVQAPDQTAAGGSSPMPGYDGYSATVTVTAEAWNGVPADDVRRIEVSITSPLGESISLTAYRLNL